MAAQSIADLQKLTDEKKVHQFLRELEESEIAIDVQLDQILTQQAALKNELKTLNQSKLRLDVLTGAVENLVSIMTKTSELAETTSAKVKQLDVEQSRVQDKVKVVESIQELRHCVFGVEESMALGNYEAAAANLHRYLNFDQRIVSLMFQQTSESTISLEKIKAIEIELKEIVKREFDAAVSTLNEEQIIRFFKIFPFLNISQEGLSKYSNYLVNLIAVRADAELKNLRGAHSGKNQALFADLLTKLFEHVANIIDAQEPIVDTHYSPGKMMYIIQEVQRECDTRVKNIIDAFKEQKEVSEKVQAIKTKINLDSIDPRDLDVILGEIALMSQRSELYNQFITERVKGQIEFLNPDQESEQFQKLITKLKKTGPKGWVSQTGLNQSIQQLIAEYVLLEQLFIKKSVDKAIKIDEYEEGNYTSSCVDDVFFILKKCITRAFSSSNVDSFCAVINIVTKILEVDFMNSMTQKLASKTKFPQHVTLNNIDVSCDYLSKLKQDIESNVQSTFPKEAEKINTCLSQLSETSSIFQSTLEQGVEQFFSQNLKPQFRTIFTDSFRDLKYVLTDDEYEEKNASDVTISKFVSEIDKNSKVFQKQFTESNYHQLFQFIIQFVSTEFEKHILKLKFNQFGALLFDKHFRNLSNYFTNVTQWTTRDKFARLNQISTLLNFEKVNEIYDYWGNQSSLSWRLTSTEVKQILALRIEFKSDDINRLKL